MTTPTDAEILAEAIRSRLLDVHTALPGKIVKYDKATQLADVQLMIKRALLNDKNAVVNEDLPILPDIPVAFPRGGDFFVSFPLAAGDHVMVIFQESSIDAWQSQGPTSLPVSPGDSRRHSLTGGVAIPCMYPNTDVLTDANSNDMVVGRDGGAQIHIRTNGKIRAESGGVLDWVAQAGKVLTELAAIVSDHNTHTHSDPVSGFTGTPVTPMPSASSVASSNLKADD